MNLFRIANSRDTKVPQRLSPENRNVNHADKLHFTRHLKTLRFIITVRSQFSG